MTKHPFLSESWTAEANRIREEHRGRTAPAAQSVRMNQIVTDVPFAEGTILAHMDTSSGELVMDTGHLDHPDVTVTVNDATAKAMFVDNNPQAGMQAFMAGKVKVEGDMGKLMALGQQAPDPVAEEVSNRIAAITE